MNSKQLWELSKQLEDSKHQDIITNKVITIIWLVTSFAVAGFVLINL